MPGPRNLRWLNPRLPQTLQIAVFLLYWTAFWQLLSFLGNFGDALTGSSFFDFVIKLLLFLSVPASVLGGLGVSEERKQGYQLALIASFLPFAIRLIEGLARARNASNVGLSAYYDLGDALKDTVTGDGLLSLLFEVALIALLLHPQSREYERVWFSKARGR